MRKRSRRQGALRAVIDRAKGSVAAAWTARIASRDAARKLFPNARQVNCYELYALHLAAVPAHTVLAQNRHLIQKLRESRATRASSRFISL